MTVTITGVEETSKGSNGEKQHTLYSEILRRVKEQGLLEKKPSFYLIRTAIISLISLILWSGVIIFGINFSNSWLNVLSIAPALALLGVMAAQYGFIAHEAAHKQVFEANKINILFGTFLANLFAGMSYGFWLNKHNRHHAKPNQVGYDPDINIKVLSFTAESLAEKKGAEKWLSKHQGALFPFLLMLTGFDLIADSFLSLVKKKRYVKQRALEASLMLIRQITPIVILLFLFNPIQALFLYIIFMFSLGLFIGGAFAPNHKGMPLAPRDAKIDFFERQLFMSRNVKPSWLKDNLMGGLNYQVEHHLFPSMPRSSLNRAHYIVTDFCKEKGMPFTEVGLFESYRIIMNYLSDVGLSKGNIDPFVCPMVADLRPRS